MAPKENEMDTNTEAMPWDHLTEAQHMEARELAIIFHAEVNRNTLPSYDWIRGNADTAKTMPHRTFVAFSRAVLNAVKVQQVRA